MLPPSGHDPPQKKAEQRFVFIDENPDKPSKKAQELERAKALAHAATVSHLRRRLCVVNQRSKCISGQSSKEIRRHRNWANTTSSGTVHYALFDGYAWRDKDEASGIVSRGSMSAGTHPQSEDSDNHEQVAPEHERALDFNRRDARQLAAPNPQADFGSRNQFFLDIYHGESERVRAIIEFYAKGLHPVNDLATEVFDVANVYAAYLPMLSYPLFYDAGLIVVGLQYHQQTGMRATDLPDLIVRHVAQAVRNIRLHLDRSDWQEQSQRSGLLAAIMVLAIFEAICGNQSMAKHHMSGLRKVVDALGGLHNLPTDKAMEERGLLKFFEAGLAMAGGPGIFEDDRRPWRPQYPSPPFYPSFLAMRKSLPRGFQQLADTGQLSMDAIIVLFRAVKTDITCHTAFRREMRAEKRFGPRTFTDYADACPVFLEPTTESNILEKILCYCLLLYCHIGESSARSATNAFRSSRFQLGRLLRLYQPQTTVQLKFVLWAFIVTAESYRAQNSLSDEGVELLNCFGLRYPALAFLDWPEVERSLYGFFWTAGLSRYWAQLWTVVLGMGSGLCHEPRPL